MVKKNTLLTRLIIAFKIILTRSSSFLRYIGNEYETCTIIKSSEESIGDCKGEATEELYFDVGETFHLFRLCTFPNSLGTSRFKVMSRNKVAYLRNPEFIGYRSD